MLKIILTAITLTATACAPAYAQQSSNCADRARVLERLDTGYGESRQSIGLAANNTVVEMFASTETGTWTILSTTPDGRTCILAAGQSFENTGGDLAPIKSEIL